MGVQQMYKNPPPPNIFCLQKKNKKPLCRSLSSFLSWAYCRAVLFPCDFDRDLVWYWRQGADMHILWGFSLVYNITSLGTQLGDDIKQANKLHALEQGNPALYGNQITPDASFIHQNFPGVCPISSVDGEGKAAHITCLGADKSRKIQTLTTQATGAFMA